MGLATGTRLTRVRWLGRLPYEEAWDLQRALWEGRVSGRADADYLLLLEHPHTYTVGRTGDVANVLDGAAIAAAGAAVVEVDRGGDVTYHGPGQLVGYPIIEVPRLPNGFDMVGHLRRIEQGLIAALADLGVEAWAEPGYTGVWTRLGKVAAIGVRVSRGVSMHGFALNVDPDMAMWRHINPCGISDRPVTSLRELLGAQITLEAVVAAVAPALASALGATETETQLAAFARGAGDRFDVDRMVAEGAFSVEARGVVPILIDGRLPGEPARPPWMKVTARTDTAGYQDLKELVRGLDLNTVCEEAKCPNIYECWSQGTATMMLLGEVCTRACSFCDVTTGRPGTVDLDEPARAAEAVEKLGLHHAVLTSVNRDDLDDGGSGVFAETIRQIRDRVPECEVEVLIPDFKGEVGPLETVMAAAPAVLNHNTETVLRLQRDVRTAANYGRSLTLLARAKWLDPASSVKSGLIVGMGETEGEVLGALADLRAVGVDIITIGQYLRPTPRHRPIDRYVSPDEFKRYAAEGSRLGLSHVESGPLVRSSYHARDALASSRS